MSKVFISYRRKSWGFTQYLVEKLRERLKAEIFLDMDSVDETNFENSIVTHLRKSSVVLLVITDQTFVDRIYREDDWVRREIREALKLGLPLVLVCVEGLLPPPSLPEDIKDITRMQGVNFYPDYFTPAVENLTDFITLVSPVERKVTTNTAASIQTSHVIASPANTPTERQISGKTSLYEALDLLENGDFGKAIFLLEGLRDSGFKSLNLSIDDLLEKAKNNQKNTERHRAAQIDYEEIASLVRRNVTHDQGIAAFQRWQRDYPDFVKELDIENLRNQSQPTPLVVTQHRSSQNSMPKPFEWVEIPTGKVTLGGNDRANGGYMLKATDFNVLAFAIAKYPLTNAQFGKFVDTGGYDQKKWWTEEGWDIREKNKWTEPLYWRNTQWNKSTSPVVGISWHEAIAFCKWLSGTSEEKITLPTEQQWQRAAQGDDTQWVYPYGVHFDKRNCNVGTQGTTPVTKYEAKGKSIFNIVDMSGNVWEWCLTKYDSGSNELTGIETRVLRGGSWKYDSPITHRADYRKGTAPTFRSNDAGFRIVRL